MSERFGFDDAQFAADYIGKKIESDGLKRNNITDGVVLGSGLGGFAEKKIQGFGDKKDQRVSISFDEIYEHLGIPVKKEEGVVGHAKQLVFGPLEGSNSPDIVMAQKGRMHPYEGISTLEATFWLRVMQALQVKTLISSNAAGILTPKTLCVPSIMLIQGSRDLVNDNPLIGPNDRRFGPRFPHNGNHHPKKTRQLALKIAEEMGIKVGEGIYFRERGPNYESFEHVMQLRAMLEGIWEQGKKEGATDYLGDQTGVVGMSTTYEVQIAQHATQSEQYPAFRQDRLFVTAATNYAGGIGPNGPGAFPGHEEVTENAQVVEENFGNLVQGVMREFQKARFQANKTKESTKA